MVYGSKLQHPGGVNVGSNQAQGIRHHHLVVARAGCSSWAGGGGSWVGAAGSGRAATATAAHLRAAGLRRGTQQARVGAGAGAAPIETIPNRNPTVVVAHAPAVWDSLPSGSGGGGVALGWGDGGEAGGGDGGLGEGGGGEGAGGEGGGGDGEGGEGGGGKGGEGDGGEGGGLRDGELRKGKRGMECW